MMHFIDISKAEQISGNLCRSEDGKFVSCGRENIIGKDIEITSSASKELQKSTIDELHELKLIQLNGTQLVAKTLMAGALSFSSKYGEMAYTKTKFAIDKGKMLGVVQYSTGLKDKLHLETLAVHPNEITGNSSHKGIGSKLLVSILKEAVETGKKEVVLSPTRGAIGFYKKFGFKEDEGYLTITTERIKELYGK